MKGVVKDKFRRRLFRQFEEKRLSLKSISLDTSLPVSYRYDAMVKLSSLPRNSAKSRIKNRCAITGRSKGVYSTFRLSRIKFREYALNGLLPGIQKSSW